jgi:hypothetical protein
MPRRVLLGDISFTAAKTFPRERSGHVGQVVEVMSNRTRTHSWRSNPCPAWAGKIRLGPVAGSKVQSGAVVTWDWAIRESIDRVIAEGDEGIRGLVASLVRRAHQLLYDPVEEPVVRARVDSAIGGLLGAIE